MSGRWSSRAFSASPGAAKETMAPRDLPSSALRRPDSVAFLTKETAASPVKWSSRMATIAWGPMVSVAS